MQHKMFGENQAITKSAIAKRLIASRRALGYHEFGAQTHFARRAGLKPNAYNQYETGTNRIALDAACRLTGTYGLTLDWIYRGEMGGLPHELARALKAAGVEATSRAS